MLILSRKPGDAILIDGNIRIVVLAVDSGGVRLGIDAPASVGIVREEVLLRIAEANRLSGSGPVLGEGEREGVPPVGEGDASASAQEPGYPSPAPRPEDTPVVGQLPTE